MQLSFHPQGDANAAALLVSCNVRFAQAPGGMLLDSNPCYHDVSEQ